MQPLGLPRLPLGRTSAPLRSQSRRAGDLLLQQEQEKEPVEYGIWNARYIQICPCDCCPLSQGTRGLSEPAFSAHTSQNCTVLPAKVATPGLSVMPGERGELHQPHRPPAPRGISPGFMEQKSPWKDSRPGCSYRGRCRTRRQQR